MEDPTERRCAHTTQYKIHKVEYYILIHIDPHIHIIFTHPHYIHTSTLYSHSSPTKHQNYEFYESS